MSAETSAVARRRGPARTGVTRLAVPVLVLLVGVAGYLVVPAGPARAVFVLPSVLWLPGSSVMAALGLGRLAGSFRMPLAVLLSCVVLIAAGLAANVVLGHVPLSTLALWLGAALLPLNLLAGADQHGVPTLRALRGVTIFGVAIIASAASLWAVAASLPTTRQASYLTFSLAGPYARTQGVITASAGQRLDIPLAVGGAGNELATGLTVAVFLDGSPNGAAVPVTATGPADATARAEVDAPAAGSVCPHQISLVLERGTIPLRTVDLYVRTGTGGTCA